MSDFTLSDALGSKSKEVDTIFQEVAIFKQLIKERVHSLDLLREILSNSGAKEVSASKIEISYTKDREGHIFEITDDGCGMNYTGNIHMPGRLDKFLGLGLSGIIGLESDEFSWKGLGSKLSYQSRRVEINTCCGEDQPFFDVRINEPWKTIENNQIPRPRISEHPSEAKGTKLRIIGHPPHRLEEPFTFQEIKDFLQHRTFVGFTRPRDPRPEILLSVLGRTEQIEFGFPEFRGINFDNFQHEGMYLDAGAKTLYINMTPKSSKALRVKVKGFITWDADRHGLSSDKKNTGLILSVKGIPYFNLDMEEYGVTTLRTARPGEKKTCLVVECDQIHEEMNISRSGLVDSARTLELKREVAEIFRRLESSSEYLTFRTLQEKEKKEQHAIVLAEEKRLIEHKDQNWVIYQKENEQPIVLIREPRNEAEVNAILWKLEALNALPFKYFRTLAYIGAGKGPDILAVYQEESGSEPQRATVFEIELNFYNYKSHGHTPAQYPKVLCWDIPASGRKVKLTKSPTRGYKYTINTGDYQVHIFVIKQMEGIKVMSREELYNTGVNI